jgi:DNA-binding beta-propeller fold protein YncE
LKFGYPAGVALTGYGEVWIADRDKNRVAVFDNFGSFDHFVGDFGYPGGQLLNPEKIIVDDRDNFIVCDAGNRRLVVYDQYGNFLREVLYESLVYPQAAVSNDALLWVLDKSSGVVHCFSAAGRHLFNAGPSLVGSSRELQEPTDLAVLRGNRLLLSDSGNNRLLVCRIIYDKS